MIGRFTAGVAPRGVVLLALLFAVLVAAPWLVNDYLLTVLIIILYFAYAGQAWNIMMGFAGQLSLGHSIYVGLGGYVAATLFVRYGVGPWFGFLAAIPVAAACGAVIGYLAFRFGVAGVYFAILTIAFAEFARIGFDHLDFVNGTGGCSCRSPSTLAPICGGCAALQPCSITSSSPRRSPPWRCATFCCAAAWAISGSPSARTSRRRAPPASTPSATR